MNPPRSGAESSSRKTHLSQIPFWNIPMIYSGATIVLGLVFPHLEYRYLKDFAHGVTVPVATALFSSIASGMLALTGIVFSLAFVMLQFSRAAYFTPSDFLAQPRSRHLARIGKVHRYLSRFNFKLS